jgi:two-component system, sensor histidine kinase
MSIESSTPAPDRAVPLEARVDAAQAEMAFDRSRPSDRMGLPVALLLAWLMWPAVDHTMVVAWVAIKFTVNLVRAGIRRGFMRERDDPLRVLHWARRFEVLLVADGAVYGMLGTLLLPRGDAVMALTMLATLTGAAAVALVVMSISLRATLAITLPMLVPPMLWQLAQGERLSLFIGLGLAAFVLLVIIEGRLSARHARDMLRLRFRMDELAAQRQQALDQAQRSNEAKGQFLATMSHEVRTPLHGMLGLARLLREDTGRGHEPQTPAQLLREQRLQTLERAGQHLLAIINDVLDHSKIESQHLHLQLAPMDLHALVADVGDLCRASSGQKGLSLSVVQTLPRPCRVLGDAARLRQVLLNLTSNAQKFTARGGIVIRSSRDAEGLVTIDVSDTGPGVPEPDRERIFNAFEQLDGSFSRRHGGTGLGLTISRELARAMHGDLVCLGAADGGALFRLTLTLPWADAPAATPPAPPAVLAAPLRGRVLLAEDNPVNAIVAEALLQRLGVDVVTTADGQGAVDLACAQRFDMVLMDCQMPGIDGFQATSHIRREEGVHNRGRVPIVALTANVLQGDRERCLAAGMDEHLAKPFTESELRSVLQRYLRPAPAAAA